MAKVTVTEAILWTAIIVLFVVFGPIFTILSLNTLFGTGIAISFTSWASVMWLTIVLSSIARHRSE